MSYRLIFILMDPVYIQVQWKTKKKVVASKRDGWIPIEDTWYPLLVSVYIHIRPHRHTQRYTDTVTQTDRYTSQRKWGRHETLSRAELLLLRSWFWQHNTSKYGPLAHGYHTLRKPSRQQVREGLPLKLPFYPKARPSRIFSAAVNLCLRYRRVKKQIQISGREARADPHTESRADLVAGCSSSHSVP